MRSLVMEKRRIDGEMMRLRGLWGDAIRWVEDEDITHEMKSCEGWMR
jgi:hypothetical protein